MKYIFLNRFPMVLLSAAPTWHRAFHYMARHGGWGSPVTIWRCLWVEWTHVKFSDFDSVCVQQREASTDPLPPHPPTPCYTLVGSHVTHTPPNWSSQEGLPATVHVSHWRPEKILALPPCAPPPPGGQAITNKTTLQQWPHPWCT